MDAFGIPIALLTGMLNGSTVANAILAVLADGPMTMSDLRYSVREMLATRVPAPHIERIVEGLIDEGTIREMHHSDPRARQGGAPTEYSIMAPIQDAGYHR